MSIQKFESHVYSEEVYPVSEAEHDEVMKAIASEWEGYGEWSAQLEADPVVNESENFIVTASGRVLHKPEPPSNGRINGLEL